MSQPIRVYLPATLPILARLHADGAIGATDGYAVTPGLRDALGETDEEELAYVAYRRAADASLRLLRADPAAPRRRVVISADVPAAAAARGAGAVRPAGPVTVAAVAAVHVDGAAAEPVVADAVAAGGDESVDDELEWYDVSELSQLLA